VKSRSITIDLPPNFTAKKLEIVFLPTEETTKVGQKLQALLLSTPTEEELPEYAKVRKWMSDWTPEALPD